MSQIAQSSRIVHPRRRGMSAVALASMAIVLGALFTTVGGTASATTQAPAGAQAATAAAEPGDTTTTLPRDNRDLGNSITKPNKGADPTSPGDPGGWLQVSLFYLICGSIVAMAGLVWFRSRRARQRREAAGLDPVTLARARGEGTRAPSPLATTAAPQPSAAAGGSTDAS